MTTADEPDDGIAAGPAAGIAAGGLRTGGAEWSDGTGPDDRATDEAVRQERAVAAAAAADAEPLPRVGGAAPRPPMIVQGVASAVLAGILTALAMPGGVPLLLVLLVLQLILALGFLALVDAPASGGIFAIAAAAALAADVVALTQDGRVSGLAGLTALALVASLGHQLVRRGRSRVTESLADTLVAVVLLTGMACLLALRQLEGGEEAVTVALAAAAGALAAGRLGDKVAPRPALAVGATRGWPGLLLALGAGALVASFVAGDDGFVAGRAGLLLGLVVAVAASAADLAVDLGAAELRAGWRDARRVAALRPVGLLLPFAAIGPVAFVAGRLVLV